MNNLYFFPFTFINDRQAQAMTLFFDRFSILDIHPGTPLPGPMASLENQGILSRVPVDQDKLSVAELKARDWLDWAAVNRGNEKNLRAMIRETAFLTDDSGVAAIKSGIRKGIGGSGQNFASGPTVEPPLVFLKLADIYDREHQEIQNALDALDAENAALFAELKGEAVLAAPDRVPGDDDPGRAMTLKRIQAWWSVAFDAGLLNPDATPVLVTASRAVMDEFCASAGKAINTLDIESIKVHHNDCELTEQRHLEINRILEQMAKGVAVDPEKARLDSVGNTPVTGRIQLRFFSGDNVALNDKNPGGQVGVCLVELNS